MTDDELRSVVGACKDIVSKMLASVNGLSGQDAAEYLNLTGSSIKLHQRLRLKSYLTLFFNITCTAPLTQNHEGFVDSWEVLFLGF